LRYASGVKLKDQVVIEVLKGLWVFRRFFGYAALLVVIGWLWMSNSSLEKDVLKAQVANTEMMALLDKQNARVSQFENDAKQRKNIAVKAMATAKVVDKAHVTKANRILITVPKNSDECVAALELLREYQ
jgi:FtsZ-interacting cell division protein YlmF